MRARSSKGLRKKGAKKFLRGWFSRMGIFMIVYLFIFIFCFLGLRITSRVHASKILELLNLSTSGNIYKFSKKP